MTSLNGYTIYGAILLFSCILDFLSPEEKARAAAEAVVVHETKFMKIEQELAILKWMVGFNLAATLAVKQRISVLWCDHPLFF